MARLLAKMINMLRVIGDVLFQKLFMGNLPRLSAVGGSVQGLTAIVTGPTSGIGSATALELARRGAHVILACRNLERGEALKAAAVAAAKEAGVANPHVDVMYLDLQSLATVRSFAAEFKASKRPLHLLINNAGIYDITGRRRETADGFEQHMGTNYLGPFLLTMLLLPTLKTHASETLHGARIVNVSSLLHIGAELSGADLQLRRRYSNAVAYSNSKCAQILFTRELRRRLRNSGVHAFAVHPGEVLTEIARNIPPLLYSVHRFFNRAILLTPDQGARSSVYCASSREAVDEAEATFGYFHSNCRPILPDAVGRDEAMASVLWGYSVRAVDLPDELACNIAY